MAVQNLVLAQVLAQEVGLEKSSQLQDKKSSILL